MDREVARDPACSACPLHVGVRTVCVWSEGPTTAKIFLVGLGPGGDEDRLGRPFVGPAGEVLNDALDEADLERGDVYLTNAVKCRPPKNNPSPVQVRICVNLYLRRELVKVRPRVVVALGAVAADALVGDLAWSGRVGDYAGRGHGPGLAALQAKAWRESVGADLLITYHPSAHLRSKSRETWDGLLSTLKIARRMAYGA